MTSDPTATMSALDAAQAAEHYYEKIRRSTASLEPLYPLDTRDKVERAIPHWNELYGVIGFTTVDSAVERHLFQLPGMETLVPAARNAVRECEGAFEEAFAAEVSAAASPHLARDALARFPVHAFYTHAAEVEWTTATLVLGRTPASVAILGAGALPETCIWIQDWARARGDRVRVHNVEIMPGRSEAGRRVLEALGLADGDSSFETGDAGTTPRDLSSFDVVYFNATIGTTEEEKEKVLIEVASRMRSGAVMVSRGSHSLKSLFYPPIKMNTPALMKKLRPVLTSHMSGEEGRSVSASIIGARVL